MAGQCTPTIAQNAKTNEWYIVTSWHKKDHPKTKYNITAQIHHIIGNAIEQFIKHMEAEAKKSLETASETVSETEATS